VLLTELFDFNLNELQGMPLSPKEVEYIKSQLQLAVKQKIDLKAFGEWVHNKFGAPGLQLAVTLMKQITGRSPDTVPTTAQKRSVTHEELRVSPEDDIPYVDAASLKDLVRKIKDAPDARHAAVLRNQYFRYLDQIRARHSQGHQDDGYSTRVHKLVQRISETEFEIVEGRSKAVTGGEYAKSNGFFYKGGWFLPSTEAPPGTWKVKGKIFPKGRKEQIAPGEWEVSPTPLSRSIYSVIYGHCTMCNGKLIPHPGAIEAGSISPDMEITPGVKGILGKTSYTLQTMIDVYNKGGRWIDIDPDAEILTDDQPRLSEANRVGTALHKNQVPFEYRQYPIIGQGATSVVLEKDPATVLVLTRDGHKKDWLCNGIGIADWIGTHEISHPNPRIRDLPVYVLKCPKLLPLSPESKKHIRKEIKLWEQVYNEYRWKGAYGRNTKQQMALNTQDAMQDYVEKYPNGLFVQLFDHLSNYDMSTVSPDLLMRNFMQDAQGHIVLIDPIVDQEILAAFRDKGRY
jgi:hypothetical protein